MPNVNVCLMLTIETQTGLALRAVVNSPKQGVPWHTRGVPGKDRNIVHQ